MTTRTTQYSTPFALQPRPMSALRFAGTPRNSRMLARILTILFFTIAAALIFTPWQQNVFGKGRVVAFAPIERQQPIQAPIDGRVVNWHVVEGSKVIKGDVIVEMSDNDPDILERLGREREAIDGTLRAAIEKAGSLESKILQLESTRISAVSAAQSRIEAARDKVRAAQQKVTAAEANLETAQLNIDRQRNLAKKGLSSTRTLELTQLTYNKAVADLESARAGLAAERNNLLAIEADLRKIDADAQSKIEDSRASVATARSDAEKARAELTKIDVRLARQSTQRIVSPTSGTVWRVLARQGGDQIKAGQTLAILVPESSKNVVELWMDGNDIPLIEVGRHVRLQFEGWPALQFSGWPSIAVGTFGGDVLLVDSTDNGQGMFRILVEADPSDDPWPSERYLRQGALANGWVLLNQVPLYYELWRQFNGFPPVIAMDEPGLAGLATKDGSK